MTNAPVLSSQPSNPEMRQESRTIHDPFLGKDVQISDRLTDRLRGKYANGPTMENGEPEFGWRQYPTISIQLDAAETIERLTERCEAYKGQVKAGSGEIASLKARIEELSEQVFQLNRLGSYVQHHVGCYVNDKLKRTCDCGLNDIRAALQSSTPEVTG